MLRRISHISIWLCLGLSVLAGLYFSVQLWRLKVDNHLILQLQSGQDVAVEQIVDKPQLRFARAYYLKQKKRYDEALATLATLLNIQESHLQAKVRYNQGNIYLEQAVGYVESMDMNRAMPLLALAKQAYRQALRLEPHLWDAKYNLDVAMRLLPELERLNLEKEDPQAKQTQLWTAVPGFPRGLP